MATSGNRVKKISIYNIAKEAGVSTATVSKIVNNHGKISQETSARVLEIIKRHNYIPQQRKQSENAIGVMTFLNKRRPLTSSFMGRLLNGVCLQSFAEGKDMILIDGERLTNATPDELYCYYASHSLAGLLVCNKLAEDPFCMRLRESGVPFVLLANPAQGTGINFIATRNYEAVSELVDYMICLGHRRIAYLGMLNELLGSHYDRLRAFHDTNAKYGIKPRPEFIIDLPNDETATIRNALLRLLARKEPPTALFIASEECEMVFPLLSEMGIDIPNTLSVAGMRIESEDAELEPDYSCIVQPTGMIGRRSVLALLELAAGKRNSVYELLNNTVNYGKTVRRIS